MKLPDWWTRKEGERKRTDKLERKIAQEFNARQHKNSGAMVEKYDMSTDELLIEHKSTLKSSFTIKLLLWRQLAKKATTREPVLILDISGNELVVIRKEFFRFLVESKNLDA